MTKEETAERIKAMQAYVDGKTIEFFNVYTGQWEICVNPLWADTDVYRIAEDSKYRPYNSAEEAFKEAKKHGFWVKHISGGYYMIIEAVYDDAFRSPYMGMTDSYESLLRLYVWADTDEPCGILEE